jgi:hypothetical protein
MVFKVKMNLEEKSEVIKHVWDSLVNLSDLKSFIGREYKVYFFKLNQAIIICIKLQDVKCNFFFSFSCNCNVIITVRTEM